MVGAEEGAIAELAEAIRGASRCVALTGAGVSTLSGIQDFRGKNGLYRTMNADTIFDISIFRHDPSYFYRMSSDFIYALDDKKPSTVHMALAALESAGYLDAVITQNIDLLHTKAGSRRVIEIHGSPAVHHCLSCGFQEGFLEVANVVRRVEIPRCPACGGILKPDITFFGEALPKKALEEAIDESRKADLMLVLGTSLIVHPAAGLPERTLRAGGRIVLVNDMPTALDDRAFLRFEDLETTFTCLLRTLELDR